jgi:predicted nucleotidyltransferase
MSSWDYGGKVSTAWNLCLSVVANRWGRTLASENITVFRAPTAGDPVLAEVVRRLLEAYRPEGIYLFGSVARGDAGPDSDYDLLVVVPDDAPPERQRSRLAYEVLRGTGTPADVLVCTCSYFEQRRLLKASLPGTVLREGRALHGA